MNLTRATDALKKYFGYDHFRSLQEEVITGVYEGSDSLVLMPTGGGKSICFQIPAITMEGTCLVVSPLISLMKDQVESLTSNGIKAAFLNSSLSSADQRDTEEGFFNGVYDLLYVSPEKLLSQSFFPLLQNTKICLFAIDEAHCISAWGHDFRKEYTQLRFLKEQFPNIPVIALTATADKVTREDIIKQLNLDNATLFVASFDRPNLSLEVRLGRKRFEQIVKFIQKRPAQPGIIYCLSRKKTEDIADKLKLKGINAQCYHAGMVPSKRAKAQEDFINDNVDVICATIAFGMGIDKSNVRWVIHHNLPKNIENYYQEIGRAGRDGAKADTLLFYSYGDVMILRDILSGNDSDNFDIQISKLERMRQYAEALACRRRILLNYFGEDLSENCGNCDTCKNPPQQFDGTIIAQKALSAVYRLQEKVGIGLLIDVLRGSGKSIIFQRNFNKIKTYGAGRDLTYGEWQQYLYQLLNLGYIEIAYDQNNVVKLTPASKRVLFEKEQVELVKTVEIKARQEAEKKKAKKVTKRQRVRDELFEELRQIRKELAQKRGVPPYIIFSDATLEEMAAERPVNEEQFRNISGVGEQKLRQYGKIFREAILDFISVKPSNIKGESFEVTLQLYNQGFSPEEIAEKRELNQQTVFSHLATLYENGNNINLKKYVSKKEFALVAEILSSMSPPYVLKPIYDELKEAVPYDTIRMAVAIYQRAKGRY